MHTALHDSRRVHTALHDSQRVHTTLLWSRGPPLVKFQRTAQQITDIKSTGHSMNTIAESLEHKYKELYEAFFIILAS